jgi:hypothetical protein
VDIDALYNSYLTFEGVVGKGYLGDIAIDDTSYLTGLCPPRRFSCLIHAISNS